MINELLLFSGKDIPFTEAQLLIHQPTIEEIAFIGESNLHIGCELLTFSKDRLTLKDKERLRGFDDFEILVSMMTQKNIAFLAQNNCAKQVLSLLFPQYNVTIANNSIYLQKEGEEIHAINKENFPHFKEILVKIFCLEKMVDEDFKPKGDVAAKMAERFRQRREKLNKMKSDATVSTVYGTYISILAVGEQKDIHDLYKYTIYQLVDEFDRYMLKYNHDIYLNAKIAGASGMDEAEDWTKDLHT